MDFFLPSFGLFTVLAWADKIFSNKYPPQQSGMIDNHEWFSPFMDSAERYTELRQQITVHGIFFFRIEVWFLNMYLVIKSTYFMISLSRNNGGFDQRKPLVHMELLPYLVCHSHHSVQTCTLTDFYLFKAIVFPALFEGLGDTLLTFFWNFQTRIMSQSVYGTWAKLRSFHCQTLLWDVNYQVIVFNVTTKTVELNFSKRNQ